MSEKTVSRLMIVSLVFLGSISIAFECQFLVALDFLGVSVNISFSLLLLKMAFCFNSHVSVS